MFGLFISTSWFVWNELSGEFLESLWLEAFKVRLDELSEVILMWHRDTDGGEGALRSCPALFL